MYKPQQCLNCKYLDDYDCYNSICRHPSNYVKRHRPILDMFKDTPTLQKPIDRNPYNNCKDFSRSVGGLVLKWFFIFILVYIFIF